MNYHTVWGAKSKQKTQNHLAIYVRSENSKHKRMYHIFLKTFLFFCNLKKRSAYITENMW